VPGLPNIAPKKFDTTSNAVISAEIGVYDFS